MRARAGDAAHARHLDVHDDDVGMGAVRDVQRFLGGCRLADAFDALGVIEDQAQAGPQDAVIVDEQYANRGFGHLRFAFGISDATAIIARRAVARDASAAAADRVAAADDGPPCGPRPRVGPRRNLPIPPPSSRVEFPP